VKVGDLIKYVSCIQREYIGLIIKQNKTETIVSWLHLGSSESIDKYPRHKIQVISKGS
jgi:hypothetical protein